MGKDPISVTFRIAAATTQVVVGASLLDIGKLIKKISRKQNCTIIKI